MTAGALLCCAATLGACVAPGDDAHPAGLYYRHAYPEVRDAVRRRAADARSVNVVLDSMRLGAAAMADGDLDEGERALVRAYDYLTTGQVNAEDRAFGSAVFYEGLRVWTGEPFEQAMLYYYLSALYMQKGEWDNARAAASNSLFALRDFEDLEQQVREGRAREQEALRLGVRPPAEPLKYRSVESEFSLGYLMAATSYVLQGQGADGRRMFERVRELNPRLGPLTTALQRGDYNTLLLVDLGRGPSKQAHGPDGSLVRFVPDGRTMDSPRAQVLVDGRVVKHAGAEPVVDLWRLAQYPRWWSLKSVRQAKSVLGTALLIGGAIAAAEGANDRHHHHRRGRGRGRHDHHVDKDLYYGGLGAMLAGLALKASARADTRSLRMLPRCVFMVPLDLAPGAHRVRLEFGGAPNSDGTWFELAGGQAGKPRVYYLRMHDGEGQGMPRWADKPLYSVRADDYAPGDRPWVLGGTDLSPPSPELIDAYHGAGILADHGLSDLQDLYRGEGVVFTPGPQGRKDPSAFDPGLYRHLAEGGRVLFTPRPGNHQYQRLTRLRHAPYIPRSERLQRLVRILQVPGPDRGRPRLTERSPR
ncbi:MAG: hypothetical protein OER86_09870 [Phycisphaerae bacterium]|nr:hypothetical protein [Phycisphaerae bacterium]